MVIFILSTPVRKGCSVLKHKVEINASYQHLAVDAL